jgi:transcription elongation GreA/GreB family factor
MIESRIIEIESLIADAVIIDESSVSIKKSDRIVRYGSIVTVELNDTIHKFKIVSTGEVKFQPEVEVISFNSPVGAAVE